MILYSIDYCDVSDWFDSARTKVLGSIATEHVDFICLVSLTKYIL